MDGVDKMFKMAVNISTNIERVNNVAIKQSTGKMIDANEAQLDKGILSTGATITPKYSPFTQKIKGFSTPNLLDTGDFRRSIFVDVKPDKNIFGATDWKKAKLEEKYSTNILGLTIANEEKIFNSEVYPRDSKYINDEASKVF